MVDESIKQATGKLSPEDVKELTVLAGITPQTIYFWRNGLRNPDRWLCKYIMLAMPGTTLAAWAGECLQSREGG